MNERKIDSGYLLVLTAGEKIIDQLTSFCTNNDIKAAMVSGIGATSTAEIGFRDPDNKTYKFQVMTEPMELTNLWGTLALFNDELTAHIHVTLSDRQLHAYGGHLKEAVVGGTCELKLEVLDQPLTRLHDEATGLNLLQL